MTMTFSLREADATTPELSEFVLANRALRPGVWLLADTVTAIEAGAPCPPERHDAIVWFAEHVLHEVAEHHRTEDDILWPVIVAAANPDLRRGAHRARRRPRRTRRPRRGAPVPGHPSPPSGAGLRESAGPAARCTTRARTGDSCGPG